jgi:hypothetical protein
MSMPRYLSRRGFLRASLMGTVALGLGGRAGARAVAGVQTGVRNSATRVALTSGDDHLHLLHLGPDRVIALRVRPSY